jgi:hypothetical protein
VKETAFSGVFATAAELAAHQAIPLVHDPLYAGWELRLLRLMPYCLGEPCDAAIVHTDHHAYAALAPSDLPGVRALVDGRAITDPRLWAAIPRRVLGGGPPQQALGYAGHDTAGGLATGNDGARPDRRG